MEKNKIKAQLRDDYHERINQAAWQPNAYVTELGTVLMAPNGEYAAIALQTTMLISLLIESSRWGEWS